MSMRKGMGKGVGIGVGVGVINGNQSTTGCASTSASSLASSANTNAYNNNNNDANNNSTNNANNANNANNNANNNASASIIVSTSYQPASHNPHPHPHNNNIKGTAPTPIPTIAPTTTATPIATSTNTNTNKRKAKYSHLLEDPAIRRWYENVARGSLITADVCLRRLGNFCSQYNITPHTLLEMGEVEVTNLLLDYVSSVEHVYAGSYIKSTLKAIKSWLSHNGRGILAKQIKVKEDNPTLREERVPTQEELRKIILAGDKKARVAVVLMAHSGLRPEVLGNYKGNDGLRLKDIPDLAIAGNNDASRGGYHYYKIEGSPSYYYSTTTDTVSFLRVPAMIVVRRELSKARHQYITFLSEEGCSYLKDYLEERIRNGEVLTPNSPVIRPKSAKKEFIRTVNIGDIVRKAIRSAGFKWRPYVLRAYFDTQLMLAESKGLLIRDYREFFMGHKGDIEHRYTLQKRLPPDVIEDMRQSYAKAQRFLVTTTVEKEREDIRKAFRREILLTVGFTEQEVKGIDLDMEDEEFQQLVRDRLLKRLAGNARQKIINMSELEYYITQGWEFVTILPNNKVVVKLPLV